MRKITTLNGALFIAIVIFSLMRFTVEVEISDNTATIVRELELKAEIEDFALVDVLFIWQPIAMIIFVSINMTLLGSYFNNRYQ